MLLHKPLKTVSIPWRFAPTYRPQIWGGDAFQRVLQRQLVTSQPLGESWEVYSGSRVSDEVPQSGAPCSLAELVDQHGDDVFGHHCHVRTFPWTIKWLDCSLPLSVQVHPADALARRIDPSHRGKSEVWVVRDVTDDAQVYLGWKPSVEFEDIEQSVLRGDDLTPLMQTFKPRKHQVISIPAGTVHAASGVLMAEFQQPSDTTYRLYDWGRTDSAGQPRPLHIAAAMASLDLKSTGSVVACDHACDAPSEQSVFEADWLSLKRYVVEDSLDVPSDGKMSVWVVFEGHMEVSAWNTEFLQQVGQGQTWLMPAACTGLTWRAQSPGQPAVLLRAELP